MPASQEQKVDFLLKKIGYSASKTGIAEDESTISSSSNTAKAPFEEGIASPLVIPQSSILADSGYIPTTPPGSDTPYVKRYPTSSALRMTRDSTVGTNTRSYIAYTTYNDTSSVRLTNWIDTQFGASYIIKVYKGDPNSGGVELQQAGANAGTDGWFFDYSSGILNFNGVNLPSGISATNIYIVGYRYIGATGIRPPAGIGTFESLHVAGVSTFMGNIDANSDLDVDGQTNLDDVSIAGVTTAIGNITIQNTYPSLFLIDSDNNDDFSLQNQNGVFAVRDETNNENRLTINSSGIATFANNLNVNEDLNVTGNAGIGSLSVSGISTFTSAIDANSNLTVSGISTFTGNIDANGIIEGIAGQNKIPSLYANYSDLPSAATYHGMFAHVHATGRGYYAHAGGWFELVNKEVDQRIGTGTETYNVGYLDATNLDVTGITTLGNIGISTGRITGPAITYIDPATVGDDTGLLVVKGNLQVEGTQTVVNSSTMTVTDKNIELAKGAANNAAADGGGITIDAGSDADKTWQWVDATDSWTSSEDIRIPDGKVFGFTPDVNTYIGRPAAETIAFTHGGSEKVRITSTGNVGIGSVTPQQKLTVSGGSIHVDSSGQTGNHDDIPFTGTRYNANVDGAVLFLQHSRSNTIGTKVALNVGDEVGAISFRSYNSDLSGYRSNATITAVVTGAATTGGVPSALIFSTGETNSNAQEKLRITSTGNVGINTNSPREKLDVVGDTILQGTLSVTGITTVTGNADLNGNLDVDGHTNLDNVSVAGVTTFSDDVTFTTASGNNIVFDKSDNSLKFGDGVVGKFGTGNDMTVYHSGSHSYIENTTNFLFIHSNSLALRSLSQETFIDCSLNGSVDLYYDNTKRFETTNTGVNITGITTTTQLEIGTLGQTLVGITTILDEDNFASDSATALATQQSIKAYVDGGSSPSSSLAVSADSGSNESINLVTEVLDIEGTANEIETATGTNKVVIGLPDNVSIGGTLNVGVGLSVVGVSTFNDDVKFTGNNYNVLWDKSDDSLKFDALAKIKLNDSFQFYHNTNGVIHNTAGITFIYGSGSGNISIQAQSGAQNIACAPNGGTSLYYQGNQKFYTTNTGINVTGDTETDTLNTGNATFTGTISAGSTTGTDGYYLKSVGTGVTWAAFPSSRTGLTTSATAGQTSFNFSYNVGFVDVFLNGVKLPESEFTASNGSTIVLDDAAFANDTLEFISLNTLPVSSGGAQNLTGLADVTISGTPVIGETLQHNGSEFVNDYTVSTTTTSTSQTAILSLPVATYRSVEYTIQITEGTKYHVTKVLAIHDGTNATFNEFGTLTTNTSLSTFALDVNSGNMRLLATPASTNSTVFKVKFTGIKV